MERSKEVVRADIAATERRLAELRKELAQLTIVGWVSEYSAGDRDVFSVSEDDRAGRYGGWIVEDGLLTQVVYDPEEVHSSLKWGVPRALSSGEVCCAFRTEAEARAWVEAFDPK